MVLAPDTAKAFERFRSGLIPPDETIRAVIRAVPKGESWRRSQQMQVRMPNPKPTPITLTGQAARWPTHFARHESEPNAWAADAEWFFWVVVTDKQLHAFEGHLNQKGLKQDPSAGPEAASFSLDLIDEIYFDKNVGISLLTIALKDGSVIELEAGRQDFDAFMEAIKPYERADSKRAAQRKGWMPNFFRWALGFAFLIGGMAVAIGAGESAIDDRLLAEKGMGATATVADLGSDRQGNETLDVTYSDEFGFSGEATIESCAGVADKASGDSLPIVYDPDDLATARAADCESSTSPSMPLLIIGVVAMIIGVIYLLQAWSYVDWKRRRLGIAIAILGVILFAAALSEGFYYVESMYFGAALVIIGVAAQFIPSRSREASAL